MAVSADSFLFFSCLGINARARKEEERKEKIRLNFSIFAAQNYIKYRA
jgi:hypothetical protein